MAAETTQENKMNITIEVEGKSFSISVPVNLSGAELGEYINQQIEQIKQTQKDAEKTLKASAVGASDTSPIDPKENEEEKVALVSESVASQEDLLKAKSNKNSLNLPEEMEDVLISKKTKEESFSVFGDVNLDKGEEVGKDAAKEDIENKEKQLHKDYIEELMEEAVEDHVKPEDNLFIESETSQNQDMNKDSFIGITESKEDKNSSNSINWGEVLARFDEKGNGEDKESQANNFQEEKQNQGLGISENLEQNHSSSVFENGESVKGYSIKENQKIGEFSESKIIGKDYKEQEIEDKSVSNRNFFGRNSKEKPENLDKNNKKKNIDKETLEKVNRLRGLPLTRQGKSVDKPYQYNHKNKSADSKEMQQNLLKLAQRAKGISK